MFTIVVKAPKIRSLVLPRPGQTHKDRKRLQKKYACRSKGRSQREDW